MTGAKGNIEYLLLFDRKDSGQDYKPVIEAVVNRSHEELG
jgi:hypothetical protein